MSALCYQKLPQAEKRLRAFIREYKRQWEKENRPFGFEVQEYRLYGALGRLSGVKERLQAYLTGKIERIAELEEEKLSRSIDATDEFNGCKLYNGVLVTISYGIN